MLSTNLDGQVSSSTVHCLWSSFWVRYLRSLSELGVDGTSNLFVINIGLLNLFKQEKQVLQKWRIERDVNIFNTRKTIYEHYCILLGRRSYFQCDHPSHVKVHNCLFIEEIEHNRIKNPSWQEETSWLFTSMTGYLNLEIPRINSASG